MMPHSIHVAKSKGFARIGNFRMCSNNLALAVVLIFSGCDEAYNEAHDYRFATPLPTGTIVSDYRSEDDVLVLIAQIQSEALAKSFLENAGFTKTTTHSIGVAPWEFEELKRVLREFGIKQPLKNQGWSMNRDAYTCFEGWTKSGRRAQVFQSNDHLHLLFWIEARGG